MIQEASRCKERSSRMYQCDRVAVGHTPAANAADPVKVGVMDQQIVIERSKAGKRALEEMKGYSLTRQKIINADDQELKELEQTIQDPKLSDTAKQEKQGQFQAKLEAYQRRLADFNREIQPKQREMVANIRRRFRRPLRQSQRKKGARRSSTRETTR